MKLKKVADRGLDALRIALTGVALFQFSIGTPVVNAQQEADNSSKTTTPIKHVIVIIGENRSFDHVFATYVPRSGQTVHNLLSEHIINADGTPGPDFKKAQQLSATDTAQDAFLLSPPKEEYPGNILPTPLAGGPSGAQGYFTPTTSTPACPTLPSLTPEQCAAVTENGLPTSSLVPGTQYGNYASLASGGTGIKSKTPDTRINDVTGLDSGPFQLSPGAPSNTYAASPVHRFYQMWQQENCSLEHATWDNPSGCNAKLFSWVEVTMGAGNNGDTQPPLCSPGDTTTCFSYNYLPNTPGQQTTGEGSTALGFYNVQKGDAPYFKSLADNFAMSDNFHQSVDGGTGANHIMFGHGDAIWFSDGNGHAAVPPENTEVFTDSYDGGPNPSAGVVNEIENPNPQAGTNNWWTQDGYGNAYNAGYPPPFTVSPVSGGGSYSDCSDSSQPGVGPIVAYLKSIHIDPRCEHGHYYLLNNYNPGYFGQGENAYADQNPSNTPFTIPPSSTPSIGDTMLAHHVSWKYYGDQWNNYAGNAQLNIPEDKYQLNYGTNGPNADEYCNICNPFQYDTSIMANAAIRNAHIQDTLNLYDDIKNGNLPAVSIVKPSGYVDGHPASSKLDMFEGFTKKIVDEVLKSQYAKDTAIFITEDEGGGYYDSGYVQPLDFFGDGTRIIFLVVAPYLKSQGEISHEYADHVSILKFIERNWNLPPVTHRSRDNFPNPIASHDNPYVPQNSPAIGDLFDFFDFSQPCN
jgi:phospholipase C